MDRFEESSLLLCSATSVVFQVQFLRTNFDIENTENLYIHVSNDSNISIINHF
jgi:hypothetical protein